MRVFTGSVATESNTFAPVPTGAAAFEEHGVIGRGGPPPVNEISPFFDALERLAREGGHTLIQGLGAYATPGGTTRRDVWESLRDELLEGLAAALPVDAVVLPLHGAMVADGYDDCEGDLLERVRALVGRGVAIGVELDLHCHFSERMRRAADVIVAYKEYPHTDVVERLEETWHLTLATAEGRIAPCIAVYDCRMVGMWHTTVEPMRSFVAEMSALEGHDGVLSVSFGHGFACGDVPDNGAKVWVVGDLRVHPNAHRYEALARELGGTIWRLRDATRPPRLSLDEALDRIPAIADGRPLVIADSADNPGGGAPGDSTYVLARLLERGMSGIAVGALWDPMVARFAAEAGIGSRFDARLGGKSGLHSGAPVDARVEVRAVLPNLVQTGLGASFDCGLSAWLRTEGGVDVVVITTRHQVFGPDVFTGLGINLGALRAVVVKSSQHFRDAFEPLASDIVYASTPGLMRDDVENIPYRRRDLAYWPRVADPWSC